MIIADLHIHSRYSRATARSLDPEHLWLLAQLKGLDLVGTGDFTHPAWHQELNEKLLLTSDGAYQLRPDLQQILAPEIPAGCARSVRFVPSGEISCIYKKAGQTRKIHCLILMPDLAAAASLNRRLERLGNIHSDGRPILGLDARDLLEICLEVSPQTIFIPAHIWTPWFSLFGSKSGFDHIRDCFEDLTPYIKALETGLSSDPAMNHRISALDGYILVSNSDAHSPGNLAREANLLNCQPNYPELYQTLNDADGPNFLGTLEFFPDQGKYHLDGHRKCNVRLTPQETRTLRGLCPVCGHGVTIGVLNRVDELADRPYDYKSNGAKPFESLTPLPDLLSEVLQKGTASQVLQTTQTQLLKTIGPELYILRQAPLEEIKGIKAPQPWLGELLAEALKRLRQGHIFLEGGYDGEFGKVKVFNPGERENLLGQHQLWAFDSPRPQTTPKIKNVPAAYAEHDNLKINQTRGDLLNPAQQAAVDYDQGHLLVRAGPGTGKTHLLIQKALALLKKGIAPSEILLITFTRKAAQELKERLTAQESERIDVATFHSLGHQIIAGQLGHAPRLLDEDERDGLLKELASSLKIKPAALGLALSKAKQTTHSDLSPDLAEALHRYDAQLKDMQALDLDDLVLQAVLMLESRFHSGQPVRQYSRILVDEYQDLNQIQAAFLRLLCPPQGRITAIGDPDQAIYGFRGADQTLFRQFSQRFLNAGLISLDINYRNSASILELAAALIAHDPDASRADFKATAGPGFKPQAWDLPSPEAEARWLAKEVVNLLGGLDSRQVHGLKAAGANYGAKDIAVLYRLHAQGPIIRQALEEAGVPVQMAVKQPLGELDPFDFKAQRVNLMTMHAAKGLEFPVVFIAGLEQGIMPYDPPGEEPASLAEERRLLYVALTRAKQRLYLSRARVRSLYGQTRKDQPSPFWAELPAKLLARQSQHNQMRRQQLGLF